MAKVLDIHFNLEQWFCLCGGHEHKDFSFMVGKEKQKDWKWEMGQVINCDCNKSSFIEWASGFNLTLNDSELVLMGNSSASIHLW